MAIEYRDDIDGLRAVAVVPIVLFHAGVSRLSGGFIGVDIFFVISGFLITSIIQRELSADRFSLMDFYHRRVARIFPALFFMLAVTLVAGSIYLMPDALRSLGNSIAAAAGFASNIFFWWETDYFDAAAEAKPLLHTWSLGVEEQFYLFYPLLLGFIHRTMPGKAVPIVAGVSAASFLFALWLYHHDASAAFYLLPTRAWELGLGGLVALGGIPRLTRPLVRNAAAFAGLALIAAGYAIIDHHVMFPAPWALLPALGTALLIAYGRDAPTAWLLSLQPMRWLGAISYSLYLWHWPIITFYRLEYGMTLSHVETLALTAASVLAAAASYYLIEQTALRRFRPKPPRPVVMGGAVALAVVVAGALAVSTHPAAWRSLPAEALRIAAYAAENDEAARYYQYRTGTCFSTNEKPDFDRAVCLASAPAKRDILLLGDSHAAQYWRAFQEHYRADHIQQATASGCHPVLDATGEARCTRLMQYAFDTLVPAKRADAIILAARWRRQHIEPLERTIAYLRGHQLPVLVIGPGVEYDGDYPFLLAQAVAKGDPARVQNLRLSDKDDLDRELAGRVRAAGATYLSVHDLECPDGQCRLLAPDGSPMHSDYGHVSLSASRFLAASLPRDWP